MQRTGWDGKSRTRGWQKHTLAGTAQQRTEPREAEAHSRRQNRNSAQEQEWRRRSRKGKEDRNSKHTVGGGNESRASGK